jgi:chemotaxis signal transduction protein
VTATRDILLFQVGVRIFAAAVDGAVRIGSIRDTPAETLVLDSPLGRPFSRERGIVVATEGEHPEHTLVIDQVLGIQSVGEDELHPLPAFAAACLSSGAVTGLVLLDRAPMPLVDLPTVVREHLARG